ncbi:MAG: helix-turn-helix transcriptional regulator [Anaerocolumna sp.]
MNINERIKFIRNKLNITQEEMAKQINIKQSSLSGIEKNRVNVSDRVIKDICREFSVSEEWIRTEHGTIFATYTEEDDLTVIMEEIVKSDDRFVKNFLLTYWGLSKDNRAIISNFIDMLSDKK